MPRLFSIVVFRMIVILCLGVGVVTSLALWLLARNLGWSRSSDVWLVAFGVPAAGLLIVIPIVLYAVRPWMYLRDMDDMLAGRAWAHWRYDAQAWRAANRMETRRNRRTSFAAALSGLGLGLAVAAVGQAMQDRDARTSLVFAGALTAGLSLLALLVMETTSPATLARFRRRGEIYISPVGIYRRPGGYTAMIGFGVVLRQVELVDGTPPHLRFITVVQGSAGATKQRWADVAVPAGREDDARQLVKRFRTEVFTPR